MLLIHPHIFSSRNPPNSSDRLPQISSSNPIARKRCFDVDSLLAPDQPSMNRRRKHQVASNEDTDGSTDIDVSI